MKRVNIRTAVAAVLLVAVLGGATQVSLAKKKKKYVFMIPVLKGLSMGAVSKMMDDFTKIISKKMGLTVEMQEYQYKKGTKPAKSIIKKVKAGKVDFTYFNGLEYVMNKKLVDKYMKPMFTITMLNKPTSEVCAYVLKDKNFKELKDLKGKRWGGTDTIPTRWLIYTQKSKSPLKKYFGKMVYINDTNASDALDALLAGKIDVYVSQKHIVEMMRNSKADYTQKITPLVCADYEHNWVFFYEKDADESVVKEFRGRMLNVHKDKDFAQFKFLLTAIKGHFVPYESDQLKTTIKIAKLAKKYDWDKEEKSFLSKYLKD